MYSQSYTTPNKIIESDNQQKGNLYLGSKHATNINHLEQLNIVAVLTIAEEFNTILPVKEHKIIKAQDEPEYQIINHFDECNNFIEENLKIGNVLVHCFYGASRSAIIVAAYMMKKFQLKILQISQNRKEKLQVLTRDLQNNCSNMKLFYLVNDQQQFYIFNYLYTHLYDLSIKIKLYTDYLGIKSIIRQSIFGYQLMKILQGNLNSISKENLELNSIGAVLTVARGVNTTLKNINHYVIEADDDDNFQLIQHFQKSLKFIETQLKSTNVLVHCFAGVSRSATIVCAYLIKKEQKSSEAIIEKLKQLRPQVNPNPGFRNQLKVFEKKVL